MEPILQTEQLCHTYSAGTPFEHHALLNVDFTAYKGEYLGLIGRTGSGKSTLMQHLNGLIKPTEGAVLLDGQDIRTIPYETLRAKFGTVFQNDFVTEGDIAHNIRFSCLSSFKRMASCTFSMKS